MKQTVFALVAALALSSCAHNPPGTTGLTLAQVATILADAAAGLDLGCAEAWLPQNVCDVGNRILGDANAAASGAASGGWAAAAKGVLVVEEARLPVDSKLRPYFDAAIPLL